MDKNLRDLEDVVSSQKEQLVRYEKRLKDVINAYKGLLKEKEALESSLAALTATSSSSNSNVAEARTTITETCIDDKNHVQNQIVTLMNSLATLSAEKSRIEASFQSDKKQLLRQLAHKDQAIADLELKVKNIGERGKKDLAEMKAKWIAERKEREQETNNQMLMIRELQKLYADERHLKENIEMQLNSLKMQFVSDEAENEGLIELQTQLKDTRQQLFQLQKANNKGQNDDEHNISNEMLFQQVQKEMQQLKEQHAIAIKNEQKRVQLAEERSTKLAFAHEERVANLEARLSELSHTVGTYDRLRQRDQKSIQELKQKLKNIDKLKQEHRSEEEEMVQTTCNSLDENVNEYNLLKIVDEITRLKMLLLKRNAQATNPIDISKIFSIGVDHAACEDLKNLQQQLQSAKSEIQLLRQKSEMQKVHISTLQEKVKVLNRNIEEQEVELKQQKNRQVQAVMDECSKWKETLGEIECEYRSKIHEIELQLQKQRQRSLQLLEEKDQEIKALQTSFEVFYTANTNAVMPSNGSLIITTDDSLNVMQSDGETIDDSSHRDPKLNLPAKPKQITTGEKCHMIHYANEIARKDIEIAGLRRAKYAAENSLRKAIQEKITTQQDLNDRISELEEQVDRLERCKTREGANLEYLKNVIISFISTKDSDGKQHMLNAISAILQFTPNEMRTIKALALSKK